MSTSDADVVVIGAGAAGLTCATVLREAGYSVMVYEKAIPGGRLVNVGAVRECPMLEDGVLGPEVAARISEKALGAGVAIEFVEVERIGKIGSGWLVHSSQAEVATDAVVVCTGYGQDMLGLDSVPALIGRGISECAVCDAPLFRDGEVLVAGSGDWGIEEALTVGEFARHVWLVSDGRLRGSKGQRRRLEALGKVTVIDGARIVGLHAGDRGVLESADVAVEGLVRQLHVDGLILGMRGEPNLEMLRWEGADAASIAESQRLDKRREWEEQGMFLAGDVKRRAEGRLLVAVNDGIEAAHKCSEYLENKQRV